MQWGIFALLSALAIGAATTVGPTTHSAAADVAPPTLVASTQPTAQPSTAALLVGLPADAGSSAPVSSTAAGRPANPHDDAQASSLASDGIPTSALQAYQNAAQRELTVDPRCGLIWPLLAGIGRVESDHGRFAGAVLHTDGVSTPHIIGIPLDGNGTARIMDTDHGRLDGDTVYDRAVGPMQFIPSTWAGYGVDGNNDGVIDPFNIFDAAAAAAHYLCAAGGDLTTLAGQMRAVRAYNDSDAYLTLVLQLESVYAGGVPGLTVPIVPADPAPAPPSEHPTLPPVNPGRPPGLTGGPSKTPTPTPSRSRSSSSGHPSGCPTSSTTASVSSSPTPSVSTCPTPTPTATAQTPSDTTSAPIDSSTSPAEISSSTGDSTEPESAGDSAPVG